MTTSDPRDVNERFTQAFNVGDLDGMLSLYEEGAVSIPAPDQVMRGLVAIRGMLQGLLAMNGVLELTAQAEPIVSGDIARTGGRCRFKVEGQDAIEMTNDEVLRRGADGEWRYVISSLQLAGV